MQRGRGAGTGALLQPGTWDGLRLAWRLVRDPRVAPRLKTAVPALAALYVLSPVDLLPDILIGLGQVDDLGVLGLAVLVLTQIVPRLAPREIVEEHLAAMGRRPGSAAADGEPDRATAKVIDVEYRVRRP